MADRLAKRWSYRANLAGAAKAKDRDQRRGMKDGDPGRIRTCDLQLRRLLLYPLSYGAKADADSI